MKRAHTAISTTLVAFLIHSSRLTNASPATDIASQEDFGAVYVMTNAPGPTGNFILSSTIGIDGKLTLGGAVSTKGNGSSFMTEGAGRDPLGAQDILQVAGDRLYAVNPGSDTISTFSINPLRPTELCLIGEPVNSGGEFPVSVAVSPKTGQVCVLNAGAINGVNCYKPDPQHGLVEIPETNRLLHRNLTTPPGGFADTPSQVIFSRDGSTLYAAVRGPTAEAGFIAGWDVDLFTGALSQDAVKSSTPSAGEPFGLTLIDGTDSLLVTDTHVGFDIFNYETPLSVAKTTGFVVPGQHAICWVRHSKQTGNYYLADIATGIITEVHIDNELQGSIVRQYPQGVNASIAEEQIGTVLGKDYLYLLSVGPRSVSVLSLEGPGNAINIQNLDLTPLASENVIIETAFLQGIAVYTN